MSRSKHKSSRRGFLKASALGLGAVTAGDSALSSLAAKFSETSALPDMLTPAPLSPIIVRITNKDVRFAAGPPIAWEPAPNSALLSMAVPTAINISVVAAMDAVRVVPKNKFQRVLGFGGCFSDAACYVIDQLQKPKREELLHELFHPSEMRLTVNRTCIGAADSAAKLYSYDDGEEDPELKRFSIEHDRAYILPVLRRVREINPDIFLFSSPWSPPGWMKWNKSMLGGSMNRQYLASYAQYLLKFLQAYAAEGVTIDAITTQNEVDTDQRGLMPACTWPQECETDFITDHIGPLFEKTNTATKIWILDHNFVYWGRVISQLDNPDFRTYVNAVAFHGYVGEPGMMSKVHAAHSDADLHFTEGSTDYNDPHYRDDWTKWGKIYTDVLKNWCRSAVAWNIATDQHGKPNIGPYPTGGIVIINPRAQEITRSGQYWTLAHFSRSILSGAHRIESQSVAANLEHVAAENPGGQKVLILTNTGAARTVEIFQEGQSAKISLAENSIASLVWT